jgi:GNAT superfamily N-acetyltransferase
MHKKVYKIRVAQSTDLAFLPEIEQAASVLFEAVSYLGLGELDLASEDVDLESEYVWVVVDVQDRPVGFAIAHFLGDAVHLHELDVHPDHGRQGLGRQLIEAVGSWARVQGKQAITLTTFRDVPWNGPYYRRLGFRILEETEITPELKAVLQEEIEAGLPVEHRVCMQFDF